MDPLTLQQVTALGLRFIAFQRAPQWVRVRVGDPSVMGDLLEGLVKIMQGTQTMDYARSQAYGGAILDTRYFWERLYGNRLVINEI